MLWLKCPVQEGCWVNDTLKCSIVKHLDEGKEMYAFAWIVIKDGKRLGKAKTGTFYLPEATVKLIHEGYELGYADDKLFGLENSKQKGGSVGNLTNQKLGRDKYYEQAVILALMPFINPHLYPEIWVDISRLRIKINHILILVVYYMFYFLNLHWIIKSAIQ